MDDEIKKAFDIWSKHSDLKFEEKKTGSVHIEIRFEKKEHGDGDPFDGPGGTLAHAFFPIYGGDAHFDDQEYWTIDDYRGSNLLQTMAHEFGHSLGLSHSDDSSALMAPFYKGYQPDVKLEKMTSKLFKRYTERVRGINHQSLALRLDLAQVVAVQVEAIKSFVLTPGSMQCLVQLTDHITYLKAETIIS